MEARDSLSAGGGPSDALDLVLRQRAHLMAFLVSMTRDFGMAEELFREVCALVSERAPRGLADNECLRWVREAARRRALATLRARAGAGAAPPERVIAELERAVAAWDERGSEVWKARKAALRECLAALPISLLKLLELRYTRDLSLQRLAEAAGRDVEAVRSELRRARRELESCVARRPATNGEART